MARIHRISGAVLWLVVWALVWTPESSPSLVIYRLGGEELPAPAEADRAGVDFVQLPWETATAAGGEVVQADLDGGILELLRYDPNQNLAPGYAERGGYMLPAGPGQTVAFDGDHSSVWIVPQYSCAEFSIYFSCSNDYGSGGTLAMWLGAIFPLNRIVILTGRDVPGTTVRNIQFYLATEFPYPDWLPSVFMGPLGSDAEVRDNRADSLVIQLDPPRPVGFLQVMVGEHNTQWEIQDIELYARGYADRGTYVSNRIDLGEPAAWGDLRWAGSMHPDAQVLIRTRSGADEDATLGPVGEEPVVVAGPVHGDDGARIQTE